MASILTLDEINLLLHSEEAKHTDLYGNLFEVLLKLKPKKAISLDELYMLDTKGRYALQQNKSNLMNAINNEWYVISVNDFDSNKKIRCGLCNTPNKYIFYIENRLNGKKLNVGSSCMTHFPQMIGYVENKKHLSKLKENHKIVKRRNEFLQHYPNVDTIIKSADAWFNSLPILIPYDIYSKIEECITRMRLIYTMYVNDGKKPFDSHFTSFELFQIALNQFADYKQNAMNFVDEHNHDDLICCRKEIDWLLSQNKKDILYEIAQNEGKYSDATLKYIYSQDFIKQNVNLFFNKHKASIISISFKPNNMIYLKTIPSVGYQPPLAFNISFKDFMKYFGAKCILINDYEYEDKELISKSKIINSTSNLYSIINYINYILRNMKYVLLFDDSTNDLILYRIFDKAICKLNTKQFIQKYASLDFLDDKAIFNYLKTLINNHNAWINAKTQDKFGEFERINNLYENYI